MQHENSPNDEFNVIPRNISKIIDGTLKHEGGFTNDLDDPGHKKRVAKGDLYDSYCTNYGITQYTLSLYLGRQATAVEIRNLTYLTAQQIYYTNYYLQPRLDQLPQYIQPFIFDCAVNHGITRAIKILQQGLQDLGAPIKVDGIMGPLTLEAVGEVAAEPFIEELVNIRINFYLSLIDENPHLIKFKRGWINRANSFLRRSY